MNSLKQVLLLLTFLLVKLTFAQKETFNWRFPINCGLTFSTNPPSFVSGGSIGMALGCSSISDNTGNLLFYTDGKTIWNKLDQVMSNGSGLLSSGFNSASQNAIIIKQPGNNSIYYVFTVPDIQTANGFRYHIVDMSLAAGIGSVTTKNMLITNNVTERLAAVKHCNNVDTWIMVQDLQQNTFKSYLLTTLGLNTTPIISSFPSQANMTYGKGSIKFSPNCSKMGLAVYSNTNISIGGFTIFDFDNSTGILTNPKLLLADHGSYSVEFSPDGSKLYGSQIGIPNGQNQFTSFNFYQWELCTDSISSVITSSYAVSSTSDHATYLQTGPDKKIYCARAGNSITVLGVLNFPNVKGSNCNYSLNAISLSNYTVNRGLPNFESSQFLEKGLPLYQYTHTAQSPCLKASFSNPKCAMRSKPPLSLTWKFGDPTSGNLNTAAGDTASHVFSAPGTYTVFLIRQFNCYTDTVVQTIAINDFFPTLTFNPKKTICTGEKATLTITGAPSFSWSGPGTTATGTNAIVQPTSNTLYTVVATATNGCTKTNTLQVVVNKCIGLNENSKAFVSIGPNPVTTDLELHAENCQLQSISIYSLDGRLVMTQVLQNTNRITVPVTDLPNGLYTTSITTEAGVVRLKMIKE